MNIITLPRKKCSKLPRASFRVTDQALLREMLRNTAMLTATAIVLRDTASHLQRRLLRGYWTNRRELQRAQRSAAACVAAIRASRINNPDALQAADHLALFLRGEPMAANTAGVD
jgi:hypothetical protein